VKADALKAAYEIEHLILGDVRILLLQADGLHREEEEGRSSDYVAGLWISRIQDEGS